MSVCSTQVPYDMMLWYQNMFIMLVKRLIFQHVGCRMDMVVSAGKSRKNVDAYILLPPDARIAVDLLIQTRDAVGVPATNPYVFARLSADTPLSGNVELQEIVQQCPGVKCPERITSTMLRRYIATVSQVIYLLISCQTHYVVSLCMLLKCIIVFYFMQCLKSSTARQITGTTCV